MRKALLVVLILSSALAWAQGGCRDKELNGQTTGGFLKAVGSASIRVCTDSASPCTLAPHIYSDAALSNEIANPISMTGSGNYYWCAAAGQYTEQISSPGNAFATLNNTPVTISGSGDVTRAGNNPFTGNNTHAGTETFNGSESHTGAATHSGTETFKLINGTRIVTGFATGGIGTSGSPWTGWESAITAAPAGSQVVFPPGFYATATGVTATADSILITGTGTRQTTITATAAMPYVLGTDGTSRHFSFQNLTINANSLATEGLHLFKGTNFDLPTVAYVHISGATGAGGHVIECQLCVFQGATADSNGGGGWLFEGNNDSVAIGIGAVSNTGVGIQVGKFVDGVTTFTGYMTFMQIDAESNTGHAIYVKDTQGNVNFFGGDVEGVPDTFDAFHISSPLVSVKGVRLSGCAQVTGANAGFNLLAGADGANIADNSVGNSPGCAGLFQTPIVDATVSNFRAGPLQSNTSGAILTNGYVQAGSNTAAAYAMRDVKTGMYSASLGEVDFAGNGTQMFSAITKTFTIHNSASFGFPAVGTPTLTYFADTGTGLGHSAAGDQCLISSGTCKLRVNGSGVQVGANGTALTAIITGTATLTYTAIAAQTCQEQPVTVTNSLVANKGVTASPQAEIGANLMFGGARVSAAGTVQVRVCNPTAGSITPAAVVWGATVIQ